MKNRLLTLLCAALALALPVRSQTPGATTALSLRDGKVVNFADGKLPAQFLAPAILRDYGVDNAAWIDGRLAGRTYAFTNLAGTGTANLFSTWNNTAHTFTRNPAAWCADLDLSCVSVANSANADGTGGNRGCLVLISPTQALTNQHFTQIYAAGVIHYFVDAGGNVYGRTVVSGGGQVGSTDLRVVTLSPALPPTIKPVRILPAGFAARVLPVGAPLLTFNQQKRAVVREFTGESSSVVTSRSALATSRTAWTADVVTGDSDSPAFAILGGVPYLLTGYTSSGAASATGPSISGQIAAINALMATGTALSVDTLPLLGTAAALEVGTAAGQLPALDMGGKFPASTQPVTALTALTGDVAASGTGSQAATLATVTTGATKGTATQVPRITYDAKGRVTGVVEVEIAFPTPPDPGAGSMVLHTTDFAATVNRVYEVRVESTAMVVTLPSGAADGDAVVFRIHSSDLAAHSGNLTFFAPDTSLTVDWSGQTDKSQVMFTHDSNVQTGWQY